MLNIIRDKKNWNRSLLKCVSFDAYHTFEYHILTKRPEETPVLIEYSEGGTHIAIPILIRNIEGTKYKDGTSVYGYAGPITNKINLKQATIDNFTSLLHTFLLKEGIVTVFHRLHPFLPNQVAIVDGLGRIENAGNVIFIDLTETLQLQRSHYNRRVRTYINKTSRLCRIYKVNMAEKILDFKKLYYENMDRINAEKDYYFTTDYFLKLNNCTQFDVTFYLIDELSTNTTIGGGILFRCGEYAQYHLSGTKEKYTNFSPTKLLIDQMRIDAYETGAKYFNLGGGRGGAQDNLFRFKASFSSNYKAFHLWKYVVDPKVYEELKNRFQNKRKSNYFPAYRG